MTTLLAVALVGAGASVVAGSGQTASTAITADAGGATQSVSEQIEVNHTVSQIDEPGIVEIEVSVDEDDVVPGADITLTTISHDVDVVSRTGFEQKYDNPTTWQMTDESGDATVTYELDIDGSSVGEFAVTDGSWALFRLPKLDSRGTIEGETGTVEYTHTADGTSAGLTDGYVGVGPHERDTATVGDATITVVHPEALQTQSSARALTDLLATIHEERAVGDLEGSYTLYAHPPSAGLAGNVIGDDTAVVDATQELTVVGSTWIHEYFHLVDGTFDGTDEVGPIEYENFLADDMVWFPEAYAQSREGLRAYEFGFGDYDEYQSQWSDVEAYDETLVEQSALTERINYVRGSLVLTAIDREIRIATDGRATFAAVHDRMSQRAEAGRDVDLDAFEEMVADVAGNDTATQTRAWIETTETPQRWTQSEHAATFGESAIVSVELGEVRVRNTSGSAALDTDDPREFSPNEAIVVEYTASNEGNAVGWFSRRVSTTDFRDYDRNDHAAGSVAPGEESTATAVVELNDTGNYYVNSEEIDNVLVDVTLDDIEGETPQDLNGDGLHRDVSGDGSFSNSDVTLFFQKQHTDVIQDHWPAYDFDGDGGVGQSDVIELFEDL